MKTLIIITFLLVAGRIVAQDSLAYMNTWKYFKDNDIDLNRLDPPKGHTVFYNCESMLFVRGNFSDTIKIWTPGLEWVHTLEQFKDVTDKSAYGKTIYAKSILPDGRILVVNSMETVFIFRNDSLYEVVDTVSKPQQYFTMMVDHVLGKIDEATFTRKRDSIDLLYKNKHEFVPKLIFTKRMFESGSKKVKLSTRVNYKQDEVELEQEWIAENKKCYLIRINNRFGKEKTSYAYAINEDIKFIWWEGCNNRN